ncbi:MAG: hypothetical protein AB7G75_37530, partial [Candidatus Binatia bacterium]
RSKGTRACLRERQLTTGWRRTGGEATCPEQTPVAAGRSAGAFGNINIKYRVNSWQAQMETLQRS